MNTVEPESITLSYLISGGVVLAKYLATMLPVTCFISKKLLGRGLISFENGFADAIYEAPTNYSALVFIGVTDITVRVLAPLVNGRFYDLVVVVTDERAQHVVSLLSGYVGGANALACYLVGMLGVDSVTTTAMGVNNMVALDTLTSQLNTRMSNFRLVAKIVNQILVSDKRVGLWQDDELTQDVSYYDRCGFITITGLNQLSGLDVLVYITLRTDLLDLPVPHWKLVSQWVVVGIGCRHDTPFPLLAALPVRQLEAQQLDPLALKAIDSTTLKKDEQGLIQPISCRHVPFETFTADVLREHEYCFPASSFTHKTVGTENVSGPAAWLLSYGKLLGETLREQGAIITLGISH